MRQHVKNKELLQRKIFEHLKSRASEYEGEVSHELKEYRQNMENLSKRDFDVVGLNYLLHKIEESQITYLGDFHTFDQSPRNFKRILQLLTSKDKKITLALELIHAENQQVIQSYLDSHITEQEFLEEINYHDSWRFPWKHYKVLFDEAKRGNLKIIALNSKGTLDERDRYASQIISKYVSDHQDHTIVCLFGEYHIASNKLPQLVNSQIDKNIKSSIIYQNIDDVYWKLNPAIREETQVIMFSEGEYSIQSSPPWIKYESMIYWFENLCEDPNFDFHESLLESHANPFNDNVFENFIYICQELNDQFDLKLEQSQLENFNLYDYHSIEFILEQVEQIEAMTDDVYDFFETMIEKGHSFKVIHKNSFYCSNYSINRLSYLAGLHLFSQYPQFNFDEAALYSSQKSNIFVFLTLRNLFGYFCSKMINPYRKCNLYNDFKQRSKFNNQDQLFNQELTEICDLIVNKGDFTTVIENKSIYQISKYSRSIGYMLGDVLYGQHSGNKGVNVLKSILFPYLKDQENIHKFSSFFLSIISIRSLHKLKKSFF